jgi:hypothetical protein
MGKPNFDINTYDPTIEGWTPEYLMWLGQKTIDEINQIARQEGRQEGIFKTLLRLLTKRFGSALPAWVLPKLQSADEQTLVLWTERIHCMRRVWRMCSNQSLKEMRSPPLQDRGGGAGGGDALLEGKRPKSLMC